MQQGQSIHTRLSGQGGQCVRLEKSFSILRLDMLDSLTAIFLRHHPHAGLLPK